MATNEHVINRSADDEIVIGKSAECLQEPPTDGGYLCSDRIFTHYIFTTYDSARGWIKTDMILDRVTLKQGKTHCGR